MSEYPRRANRMDLIKIRMRSGARPHMQNSESLSGKNQTNAPQPVQADLPAPKKMLDYTAARPALRPASKSRLHPLQKQPEDNIVDGTFKEDAKSESTAATWGMILILIIALSWGAGFLFGFQTALAILVAVGMVLAIFGLLSPSLGLLSIGMLAALDAMANIFLLTGGLLRYNTINYFLALVVALNIPFVLRLKNINARSLQIFILLLAAEILISQDKSRGVQDILNIGVTFGIVWYFARAFKDELAFFWMGLVNGFLTALGGLLYILHMSTLPYANPNDWTYFNLTGLFSICIAYPFAIKHGKSRFFLLLLAAINFAWIFLSGSRGSILIAALCGVYLFLSTRSLTWKTMMVVLAILIAGWVTANFAEQQTYTMQRIQLLFDPNVSDIKRTSKRSLIMEAGIKIFQANPLGIGTGSFSEEVTSTNLLRSQLEAHSAWIKVLAENGIPGIILMAIFIGSFAITGLHQPKEGRWLFALFITITLAGAFVAKEFRGKSLWFLVAAGIAILHQQEVLEALNNQLKTAGVSYRKRLWEIRYGRKE